MSSFVEDIWSNFAVEAEEHIESIELNLVQAEQTGATPDIIRGLFRAFHSMKGLATAMDLSALAGVAHRSEDILGLIRDGGFPLNREVVSLLLSALDEIKAHQRQAVASRTCKEENRELDRRLSETADGMKQTAAMSCLHDGMGTPSSLQGAHADAADAVPLHEDADMLAYFIELLQEQMAVLSGILEPICMPGEGFETADPLLAAGRADAPIDLLVHAARVMEFHNLVETLEQVRRALPAQPPLTDAQRDALTRSLRILYDQVRIIESLAGNGDAGAHLLHRLLRTAMDANLQHLFRQVLRGLDAFQHADENACTLRQAGGVHDDLAALNSHLSFFLKNATCNIILLLEDVFGRAARGELHVFDELIDLSREEINHAAENYRSCIMDGRCTRSSDEYSRAARTIHEYIWAYTSISDSNDPIESYRRFMAGLRVGPELIKLLSPENVRDLMQACERGEHLHEILTHLETNEQIAAGFLSWLDGSGSRVVTNRSVFIDGKSWYEMLVVSPLLRAEIDRGLKGIDPDGRFLSLSGGDDGIPETAGPLESFDQVTTTPAPPMAQAATYGNVIRVRGEMLDTFMNQIGEMVLARSRLCHLIGNERLTTLLTRLKQWNKGAVEDSSELIELVEEHRRELADADLLLDNALERLQESVMGLRVVPVELVFKRLPRVVLDLARHQGKEIRLEMNGQEVKIDKAMVDILADPLLHMVRNSVDHGIEAPEERMSKGKPRQAVIRISAVQRGNHIMVELSDDGRGVNADTVLRKALERGLVKEDAARSLAREEILRFIFLPGFSTAPVVSETSGRGVGLDVVMTSVMRMGGSVSLVSEPDSGATFTLKMPLSAAIQDVLMVEASGQTLALPGRYVSEVLGIEPGDVQTIQGNPAVLLRGSFLPLHGLARLLGYQEPTGGCRNETAVVMSNGNQRSGLLVDRVVGRQKLFTREIQHAVAAIPGVCGASILGNGRVVLILDGEDILRLARAGSGAVG